MFATALLSLVLLADPGAVPVSTAQLVPKDRAEKYGGDDAVLPGCSWYCGGWITSVTASSELAAQGANTYGAKLAHDFDARTAWVEGQADDGVGAWLEYTFAFEDGPENLGVNGVVVFNGYQKSPQAWRANGRVKRLALEVDGAPWAEIVLADTPDVQLAPFPLVMLPVGKRTVLRFRIAEVYRGERFRDTALSELLFEGVGVH